MLSEEEKREMLEDASDQSRRDSFRFSRECSNSNISFDEYLTFLNNVQQMFLPFISSTKITETSLNKL